MARFDRISSAALAGAAFLLAVPGIAAAQPQDEVERGKYLMTIMDCGGCHTTGALGGKPDPEMEVAGADVGWLIPDVGVFYPPNITPDEATGIGSWSVEEIVTAVRTGVRPDGRKLIPVMPWPHYAALTDEDARALATYLKTLPAVDHAVPPPTALDQVKTPYITIVMPEGQ